MIILWFLLFPWLALQIPLGSAAGKTIKHGMGDGL